MTITKNTINYDYDENNTLEAKVIFVLVGKNMLTITVTIGLSITEIHGCTCSMARTEVHMDASTHFSL